MFKIDLMDLLKEEYTYPNWSSGMKYRLETEIINEEEIYVFYYSTKTIMKKRFQRKKILTKKHHQFLLVI